MLKRLFDIIFAGLGVIILAPILFLICFWIKLDSPGPVLYLQNRVGFGGKAFKIFKFRTMRVGSDRQGLLTVGVDSRVTKSGKFLRKSKLDELPQLANVLLGDMSIVGPRPEVQEFVDQYPLDIRDVVLSVRPGITDLASIEMVDENLVLAKYRDAKQAYLDVVLPIKLQYYVDYVRRQSFFMDLRIIVLTISKIITR